MWPYFNSAYVLGVITVFSATVLEATYFINPWSWACSRFWYPSLLQLKCGMEMVKLNRKFSKKSFQFFTITITWHRTVYHVQMKFNSLSKNKVKYLYKTLPPTLTARSSTALWPTETHSTSLERSKHLLLAQSLSKSLPALLTYFISVQSDLISIELMY